VEQARKLTEEMAQEIPVEVLAVPVTKLGRTYFVVPYLKPQGAVSAEDIDAFRRELDTAYAELLGQARTEIIVTAEHPYPP
jgi:hypothetical protein